MLYIECVIKAPKFVSVNSMYEPNIITYGKGCTKFVGLRLAKDAREQKEFIYNELNKLESIHNFSSKLIEWDKNFPLELSIAYVLNYGVESRDLNNLHKCTIDALFEYFRLNDNDIYAEHYYKLFNKDKKDKYEYIKFKLTQMNILKEKLKV